MTLIEKKMEALMQTETRLQKKLARLNIQLAVLQDKKTTLEQSLAKIQQQRQTLQSVLQIIEDSAPLEDSLFYQRAFKSKVSLLALRVLKSNPNKAYLKRELVAEMLILDNQPQTEITERHIKSARQPLNVLYKKGVISRTETMPLYIYW